MCVFKCDLNELTLTAACINTGNLFHKEGTETEILIEDNFILDAVIVSWSWLEEKASEMVHMAADSTQGSLDSNTICIKT